MDYFDITLMRHFCGILISLYTYGSCELFLIFLGGFLGVSNSSELNNLGLGLDLSI